MTPKLPATMELTVSRTVAAPAAEVYDVWLDPKSPGSPWFGTKRAIVHAVVDGLFYHSVDHLGQSWAHYGRVLALERGKKIENTWVSAATRGLESIVTVTFEPKGERTEVTLHHTGVPDDEMGRGHQEGWGSLLAMLAERFERRAKT